MRRILRWLWLLAFVVAVGGVALIAGCGGGSTGGGGGPSLGLDGSVDVHAPWVQVGPAPLFDVTVAPQRSNQSGRVSALAPDPASGQILTVGAADGGVWRTTDGGGTWTPLADDAPTLSIGSIVLDPTDPTRVYVATGESVSSPEASTGSAAYVGYSQGIYRVGAAGGPVLLAGSTLFNRNALSRILIAPNRGTIYVGVTRDFQNGSGAFPFGVYRSIDGGATFQNVTAAVAAQLPITDLAMDPTDPNTLYAAAATARLDVDTGLGGIYKSTNGGNTWSLLNTGVASASIGRIRLCASPIDHRRILALVGNPTDAFVGLLATGDAGVTWSNLTLVNVNGAPGGGTTVADLLGGQATFSNAVWADTGSASVAYIGGIQAVRIDNIDPVNGTADAVELGPGPNGDPNASQPHVDIHSLGQDANGRLLTGCDGGVWRLDNPRAATARTPWVDLNTNLATDLCFSVDRDPQSGKMLTGMQDNGNGFAAGHLTWLEVGPSSDAGFAGFNPVRPGTAIISSQSRFFQFNPVTLATDFVTRLIGLPEGGQFPNVPLTYARDGRVAGAGTDPHTLGNALMESLDDGVTPHLEAPLPSLPTAVAYAPVDSNVLYAGTIDGRVFVRRQDSSLGFGPEDPADVVEADAGLPAGGLVSAIAVDPRDARTAVAAIGRFDVPHVFRTVDAGRTWTSISGGLPNFPANAVAIDGNRFPSTIFVGTDQGVYASTDVGQSWIPMGTGLPHVRVTQLTLSRDAVLSASTFGRSVFQVGARNTVPALMTPPLHPARAPFPAGGRSQRTYRRGR